MITLLSSILLAITIIAFFVGRTAVAMINQLEKIEVILSKLLLISESHWKHTLDRNVRLESLADQVMKEREQENKIDEDQRNKRIERLEQAFSPKKFQD